MWDPQVCLDIKYGKWVHILPLTTQLRVLAEILSMFIRNPTSFKVIRISLLGAHILTLLFAQHIDLCGKATLRWRADSGIQSHRNRHHRILYHRTRHCDPGSILVGFAVLPHTFLSLQIWFSEGDPMKHEDEESNLNGVGMTTLEVAENKWHRSVNWSNSLYAIPNVLNWLESNLLGVSSCMDHPVPVKHKKPRGSLLTYTCFDVPAPMAIYRWTCSPTILSSHLCHERPSVWVFTNSDSFPDRIWHSC